MLACTTPDVRRWPPPTSTSWRTPPKRAGDASVTPRTSSRHRRTCHALVRLLVEMPNSAYSAHHPKRPVTSAMPATTAEMVAPTPGHITHATYANTIPARILNTRSHVPSFVNTRHLGDERGKPSEGEHPQEEAKRRHPQPVVHVDPPRVVRTRWRQSLVGAVPSASQ